MKIYSRNRNLHLDNLMRPDDRLAIITFSGGMTYTLIGWGQMEASGFNASGGTNFGAAIADLSFLGSRGNDPSRLTFSVR